jgi:fluoride exporter
MIERLSWICLAGALGTGTRYLVGLWTAERFGTGFPYGTLLVNVAGCFLIALVLQLTLVVATVSPTLRLSLTTGFLGGLTTYSSFAHETAAFTQAGAHGSALLYFSLTTLSCFLALGLGLIVGRWLPL